MQSFNFVLKGRKETFLEKPEKKSKQVTRARTLSECSTDNDDQDSLFTEIQENNFEEESEATPTLHFQKSEKVLEAIQFMTKNTSMTCPCR